MRFATASILLLAIMSASATSAPEPSLAPPGDLAPDSDAAHLAPPRAHHRGWPGPAAGPTMSGDPELVLTFDDGPNPRTTPTVLDVLAKHRIRAVFFLVGDMAKQKQAEPIIQRMLREGHILANHTMTHKDLCRVKGDDQAAREIDDGKAVIEKVMGFPPTWFRAPYGVRCARVDKLLAERNLVHFHWDIDPQDWKGGNAPRIRGHVQRQLEKMTGRNVLLLHDVKKATVEALPAILDWIEAENARRAALHKRRIRFVHGYELAIERLPQGLADWIAIAAPNVDGLAARLAAVMP